MKRWQRILIIVCAVWLIGALLAVVLLRDTPEFADGEASLMVKGVLAQRGIRYTTITEKYVGQGLWEVETKILGKEKPSWVPIVFGVDERTCDITVRAIQFKGELIRLEKPLPF